MHCLTWIQKKTELNGKAIKETKQKTKMLKSEAVKGSLVGSSSLQTERFMT